MKSLNGTLLVSVLFLAACAKRPEGARPVSAGSPPTAMLPSEYKVLGPFTKENLTVFLIQKPGVRRDDLGCIILDEGLTAGTVRISEKADGAQVSKLEIENLGEKPVYIQAGDTLKGGKQDRTIAVDSILPPKSGKRDIDAFCVEPGRWATRDLDGSPHVDFTRDAECFRMGESPLATKEQKLAARVLKSQSGVWNAGSVTHSHLSVALQQDLESDIVGHSSSYVGTTESLAVQRSASEYTTPLQSAVEGKEDLVGMAYGVNGELSTIEIYPASGLFLKLWPKLLRGAAIDAISKKCDQGSNRTFAGPEIEALLERAANTAGIVENRSSDIRVRILEGKDVSLIDTERDGGLLHRQVIQR